MNKTEFHSEELKLKEQYLEGLHDLRTKYVNSNAKYRVGDFIRCVTGIIKIEDIRYQLMDDDVQIVYCGYKYQYKNKELQKILNKDKVCISEDPSKLLLINIDK
jgi:hypothetical protein